MENFTDIVEYKGYRIETVTSEGYRLSFIYRGDEFIGGTGNELLPENNTSLSLAIQIIDSL